MSSLPPALDFAKAEEDICAKWAEESTFKTQDKLGKERGDEVRLKSFGNRKMRENETCCLLASTLPLLVPFQ